MKQMGDEDLVHRVAGGDDQALSELYDRYCGQYMPRESGSWEMLIWRRSLYRTPSPTFGGELSHSSRNGRVSRRGSTASRATAPWTWIGNAE